ncbi:gamma carbonic anhydrase family protein [Rhodococcus triatomae]|nr:carbonic anhydrase [Rhodococcus triatomae BKS 15-14]
MTGPTVVSFDDGATPRLADSAWLAPTATVIGDVTLEENASIWYGAVARGDADSIRIGAGSNIQDNVTMHADPGFPLTVGADVSVGHNAVLHGCTIGDASLIGMGAVVLNGARLGANCLVAAGAVILEGTEVPPRSLVAGVPAKVRRELTDDEVKHIEFNAEGYRALSAKHRSAT